MAIADYQSLMLPVLRLAAEGETHVPDAAEKLADQLGLSFVEPKEMLPSGVSAFSIIASTGQSSPDEGRLIESPARSRFCGADAGVTYASRV
jgi:restriction system protein